MRTGAEILPQVASLAQALATRGLSLGGRRVLDVGCGTGASLPSLEALGALAPVGVDPRLPVQAPETAASARLRHGSGAALPYAPGSFDAVIFFFSLHHIPEMESALQEAARVLRSGGLLCVTEPLADGSMYALERWIDDEAGVRAEAQACLDRAEASGSWQHVLRWSYQQIEPYARLSTFVDEMLAIGGDLAEQRAARCRDNAEALAQAFAAVPDGRFEQSYLLRVFVKTDSATFAPDR